MELKGAIVLLVFIWELPYFSQHRGKSNSRASSKMRLPLLIAALLALSSVQSAENGKGGEGVVALLGAWESSLQ